MNVSFSRVLSGPSRVACVSWMCCFLGACGSDKDAPATTGGGGSLASGGRADGGAVNSGGTAGAATEGGTAAAGRSNSGGSGGGATSGGNPGMSGGAATAGSATSGGSGGAGPSRGGQASGGEPATSGGKSSDGGAGGAGASTGGNAGASTGGSAGASSACLEFAAPSKVGEIESTALDGPSGIGASRAHAGVVYGQLDAGGKAVVYAMTTAGKALAEYTLMGSTNTDWEDLAVGPGPTAGSFIYVADIGDNAARTGGTARTEIQVLRVAEPDISATQALVQRTLSGVEVLRFTYPDKPHDAETLMVDPVSHDLLIATKESDGTTVIFRAAADTPVDTSTKLEKVATVQVGASGAMTAQVSAGDASPNGDRFALRTYGNVLMWPRAATSAATFSATPKSLMGDDGPQSEGLTFSADGTSLISSGERARTIYESKATCK